MLDGEGQHRTLTASRRPKGNYDIHKMKHAMEANQAARKTSWKHKSDSIVRSSAGLNSRVGDWVVVKQADAAVAGEEFGSKLAHDRWTGPWLVENIQQHGCNVRVMMAGGIIRNRVVCTASLKIFY